MKKISCLLDPLCGWCYAAGPTFEHLAGSGKVSLRLQPIGLFAGGNARPIDGSLAHFAWTNDQRIARLTGRVFSETYRALIFDTPDIMFDSGPATLGLIAVGTSQPDRETRALTALQLARYVDGRNTADIEIVIDVLAAAGFPEAAERLSRADPELLDAYKDRVDEGRRLMDRFGVQGVPALVVEDERGGRLIEGNALYGDPELLIAHFETM